MPSRPVCIMLVKSESWSTDQTITSTEKKYPKYPDASRPHISTSGHDEVGWQLLLHLVAAEQLNAELKSCHRVDDIKSLEHVWMYDSKLAAGLVV